MFSTKKELCRGLIQQMCPIACRVPMCFRPELAAAPAIHHIWDRIHRFTPRSGRYTTCLDVSSPRAEVLSQCTGSYQALKTNGYSGGNNGFLYLTEVSTHLGADTMNVTDCAVLERSLHDAHCDFSLPSAQTVFSSEQFTISFWMQLISGSSAGPGELFTVYAGLNPPTIVLTIYGTKCNPMENAYVMSFKKNLSLNAGDRAGQDVNLPRSSVCWEPGEWARFAVTFGPQNARGQYPVRIMQNSESSEDYITAPFAMGSPFDSVTPWAVVIGRHSLVSPIEVCAPLAD